MQTRSYEAVVIGAGPGGYPCAIRLAQMGVNTLCVEKEFWGGVCLNVGCIPSKALITAGKRFEEISKAASFGIIVDGAKVDMKKVQSFKSGVVKKLTGGVETLLKGNGCDRLLGSARLDGPGRVIVTTEDGEVAVEAKHIVIATGSKPIQIPGFSYEDELVINSRGALDLDFVPEKLVVIGGGYIGLELGQMLNKIGSEVTIVEMAKTVLLGFDPDVIKLMARKLKKSKVVVHTGAKATGWEKADGRALVHVETSKGPKSFEADRILVTVGRFPNTEGLGLETLEGLEMDGRFIKIDAQCRTSVPGLFAIGDVAGQPMLAHKASHEGEICAEVIAGHKVQKEYTQVPAVVFTDPEIATAGLMEHQAKEAGYTIKVGKVPFGAIGRALTTNQTDGFIKVIVNAEDERVLGVTIIGAHASDLISEASLACEMQAEALDIGLTIHPHPTLGEGIMEAAKAARGEAVHVLNR